MWACYSLAQNLDCCSLWLRAASGGESVASLRQEKFCYAFNKQVNKQTNNQTNKPLIGVVGDIDLCITTDLYVMGQLSTRRNETTPGGPQIQNTSGCLCTTCPLDFPLPLFPPPPPGYLIGWSSEWEGSGAAPCVGAVPVAKAGRHVCFNHNRHTETEKFHLLGLL